MKNFNGFWCSNFNAQKKDGNILRGFIEKFERDFSI